jgi:uncharacterized membrane protein YgcG
MSFFGSPLLLPVTLGLALWWTYRRIGKRTPEGLRRYRELLGYRLFMERAERDRLRRLLEEDPALLERGIPYAVLFGLLSRWIGFYDTLEAPRPAWYLDDLIRLRLRLFEEAMERQSVEPSSSSSSSSVSESGGFSGGGSYSGGGGGGGGVGSW